MRNYNAELEQLHTNFNNIYGVKLDDLNEAKLNEMYRKLPSYTSKIGKIYSDATKDTSYVVPTDFASKRSKFEDEIKAKRKEIVQQINYVRANKELNDKVKDYRDMFASGRRITGYGLNDLNSMQTRINLIHRDLTALRDKINTADMNYSKKQELMRRADDLYNAEIKAEAAIKKEIERKTALEKNLKKEKADINAKIVANNVKINDIAGKIAAIQASDRPDKKALQALRAELAVLVNTNKALRARLHDIDENLIRIASGGKLIGKEAGEEKLDPIIEPERPTRTSGTTRTGTSKPRPSRPRNPEEMRKAAASRAGTKPPKKKPESEMTDEELFEEFERETMRKSTPKPKKLSALRNGKDLPTKEFLSDKDLTAILKAYNIEVDSFDAELTHEQLERLKGDHVVKRAMFNADIQAKYRKKISEYDKLINKYKTLLRDSSAVMSESYQSKLKGYIEKLEEERDETLDDFKKYNIEDYLGRGSLERRAERKNRQIRAQYAKLDKLKEEKNSKFRTKGQKQKYDKRISKVQDKIRELTEKRNKTAKKQKKIVNENSQIYIQEIQYRMNEYNARKEQIVDNVRVLEATAKRIEEAKREQAEIAAALEAAKGDKKTLKNMFYKRDLNKNNRSLRNEIARLAKKQGKLAKRSAAFVEDAARRL